MLEKLLLRWLKRDEFRSMALRDYYSRKYRITVGMYSYGCFDHTRFPPGTSFGRYCSVAPNAVVLGRNHGTQFLSTHPYLYNHTLGVVCKDKIQYSSCTIEDDVWIGHSAIIAPSVRTIGRGSIIGAGAVVTKDIKPYSIVGGNPARLIRMRFSPETIKEIERSQWWTWDKAKIKQLIDEDSPMIFAPTNYFSNEED